VHIFGPFTMVAAVGSKGRATRTVQVGDRRGTAFTVEVPTHVSVIAQFATGGVSQSVFSFDSPLARVGVVEVTGTEGTLVVPDPNHFSGDVKITRAPTYATITEAPEWESVPLTGVLAGRGTGALDMARCIRSGAQPLASGALGLHILDTLIAIEDAMTTGHTVNIRSTVDPVPLVADDWDPFAATL
jgi:predicted dehydrogenase